LYHETLQHLRNGDTILYPSDIMWELGCDARNEKAIAKMLSLKQQLDNKELVVLISKIEQLSEYVLEVPEIAWNLVEFAEKPLTVIYPKGKNLPANLMAEDGSIAIRLVKDEFCKGLVHKFERAIATTSLSIKFEDISSEIIDNVDFILKNPKGDNKNSQPSQIIKLGLDFGFEFIRK
jgi:L-threonylcarbamoyladenylate synthase